MSDASPAAPASHATPPLDEVMLAMDVVDTLRAQRTLVESELDGEARAQSFTERVKSIYASQGIEVPDAVIREAVEALEQDRFTYEPPERTLAVRMAEVYVDRGRWFRRLLGVAGIVALIWGGVAWSQGKRDRGLEEAFAARQGLFTEDVQTTEERIEALRRQITEIDRTSPEASIVTGLTSQAAALLTDVDARFQGLGTQAARLDKEAYPRDQRRMDAELETRRRAVGAVQEDLGRVEGQLEAIRRLQGLRGRITVALAQAAGLTLTPAQRMELDRLRGGAEAALAAGNADLAERHVRELREAVSKLIGAAETRRRITASFAAVQADLASMQIESSVRGETTQLRDRVRAAIESGDVQAADAHLGELRTLAQVLGAAYELRIISHPGQQSGVWRTLDDQPHVRNYYILVEPVGADGRAVAIPVRNEENQQTRMVTRLGIRVPEKVFEAVKRDKLDNGIVDRNVFGEKRRGQKKPDYRFEVVGGWITDW